MKAIGAGTMLPAIGGTAAAQGQETDGNGEPEPGDTATVHRVETLIREPATNPERPADFFYQPTGIHIQPRDVVKFVFTTPDHNVVHYHPAFGMRRRGPLGIRAFSSPLMGWRPDTIPGNRIEPPRPGEPDDEEEGVEGFAVPDTWLRTFSQPGVYDLLCSPHEAWGMAMRVVVGDDPDPEFELSDPGALPEPRAGPAGLSRLTLTDPALQPSNIVEQGTVSWESLEANRMDGSED